MIEAMIFDLDGTLVQTEKLKALSYARAALLLKPELKEADVINAFKDVVGLATMSYRSYVLRVLEILELKDAFDFVASREDVENAKPDPEIYLFVANRLAMPALDCLVIEDSPSGVKAALAAGMACIAVSTPFKRQSLHNAGLLDARWIGDEPDTLFAVVDQMMAENAKGNRG